MSEESRGVNHAFLQAGSSGWLGLLEPHPSASVMSDAGLRGSSV